MKNSIKFDGKNQIECLYFLGRNGIIHNGILKYRMKGFSWIQALPGDCIIKDDKQIKVTNCGHVICREVFNGD